MFDVVVLGVDPGTAAVGLAAVQSRAAQFTVRWTATIRTPSAVPPAERAGRLYRATRDAIEAHRPAAVAIERLLWGRNIESAMGVAQASGAILVAAAEAELPVQEYAPLEVKMAVTGVGNAPKDQVRRALIRILGTTGVPEDPDAADAVAVAICHVQQARLRHAVREAAP